MEFNLFQEFSRLFFGIVGVITFLTFALFLIGCVNLFFELRHLYKKRKIKACKK